ncbi:hypothetical protein MRS44_016224 [Fusarium solani]|uniref:uncharacterized protein n=1 Tax=Fusarium solani TaxID=169388 RepID=UPI0032C409EB|nr:hypothetical protein MRS44_016224 [Fusarium solani]
MNFCFDPWGDEVLSQYKRWLVRDTGLNASETTVSSLSLESSTSTASIVSTSSTTVLSLSTEAIISTDSTIFTSLTTASTLSTESAISADSTVFTSSGSSATTSAGKVTQTTSEESTFESTSISLTENTSAPTTTSELSTASTSSLQTVSIESTLISDGIATTSTISSTSAAPTQGGPPAVFTANPNIGPGGDTYKESEHFRIYGTIPGNVNKTLDLLEGEYDCLVNTLGWRSPGLSNYVEGEKGPWCKTNIYSVSDLGSSAGVQRADTKHGFAYLDVVTKWLDSGVTAHEFGHALHFHQRTWVYQSRTGAWWETVANWVAETYQTSDICAPAREKVHRSAASSIIEVKKLIGDSFQVIVDGSSGTGNYYQAWPFLTYLTNNPDEIPGLGRHVVRELMVQYKKDSNETPLHTLARVATTKVGSIVGSYWARMAYVDIGHAPAQKVFQQQRHSINYKNVALQYDKTYKVLPERQPRYMGCNIIPLTTSGAATVQVDIKLAEKAEFTAKFAVRDTSTGSVRYKTLEQGSGSIEVSDGEEISLVVANTPADPILYDGFKLTSDVQKGLDYSFKLSGATA